jgi:hypothetical protein
LITIPYRHFMSSSLWLYELIYILSSYATTVQPWEDDAIFEGHQVALQLANETPISRITYNYSTYTWTIH